MPRSEGNNQAGTGPRDASRLSFVLVGDMLILVALAIATVGQAGIQQCALPSTPGQVNSGTTVCPGSLLTLIVAVLLVFAGAFFVTMGLGRRRETQPTSSPGSTQPQSALRAVATPLFMLVAGTGLAAMGLLTQYLAPYFSCFQLRGGVCGAGLPASWLPDPLALLVSGLIVVTLGAMTWLLKSDKASRARDGSSTH